MKTKALRSRSLAALTVVVALAAPAGADQSACTTLPATADRLDCGCAAAGGARGQVWGSGPYTGDSDICLAAQHAGVIGPNGGAVHVERVTGQDAYPGSVRNGITSATWGTFASSIAVSAPAPDLAACAPALAAGQDSSTCQCPPASAASGAIWGTNPYTGDSDICAAARHAGVIGRAGGLVLARRVAGQDHYDGAIQNGVTSSSWGVFADSLEVTAADGAVPPDAGAVVPDAVCTGFPAAAELVTCSCPAGSGGTGVVWGSGPYTLDSDLCRAAQHAGVIGPQGGRITGLKIQGLASYVGSVRNGVGSQSWGAHAASLIFDANLTP